MCYVPLFSPTSCFVALAQRLCPTIPNLSLTLLTSPDDEFQGPFCTDGPNSKQSKKPFLLISLLIYLFSQMAETKGSFKFFYICHKQQTIVSSRLSVSSPSRLLQGTYLSLSWSKNILNDHITYLLHLVQYVQYHFKANSMSFAAEKHTM